MSTTERLFLTEDNMRFYVKQCIDHVGGQQALARYLTAQGYPVSQREINQVFHGQRSASRRLAAALGFARRIQPRRVLYERLPQVPA